MNYEEIIENYTKDIKNYLRLGLIHEQANGSFGEDLLAHFDIISERFKSYAKIEEFCEKLVSQPIYEKYEDTHEIHKEDYTECRALYSFELNRVELYLWDFVMCFELDQYGKTWAFTKEELE